MFKAGHPSQNCRWVEFYINAQICDIT